MARMTGPLRRGYFAIALIVALIVALAMVFGDRSAWGLFDYSTSKWTMLTLTAPPLIWFTWMAAVVIKRRSEHPTRAIIRMGWRQRHWLVRGTLLTGAWIPTAKAVNSLKRSIPDFVPFYADPALARMDRWLFLGTDPWRLTHAIMGPMATLIIDRAYILWFLVMLALIAWFNFTRNQRLQVRGLIAFVMAWFLLGDVAALLFSSVGPCFYEIYFHDTHFRPLMDTLREYDAMHSLKAFDAMNWLYVNRDRSRFGSGISGCRQCTWRWRSSRSWPSAMRSERSGRNGLPAPSRSSVGWVRCTSAGIMRSTACSG